MPNSSTEVSDALTGTGADAKTTTPAGGNSSGWHRPGAGHDPVSKLVKRITSCFDRDADDDRRHIWVARVLSDVFKITTVSANFLLKQYAQVENGVFSDNRS